MHSVGAWVGPRGVTAAARQAPLFRPRELTRLQSGAYKNTMTSGTTSTFSATQLGDRRTVAVVTFLSTRPELTADEETSVRHMRRFLSNYDCYAIAPKGGSLDIPGLHTIRIPRQFFGNVKRHTAFVLSPRLYEMFSEYEYILLHHLDALVLSDELLHWCAAGYDNISAPWLRLGKEWVMGAGGFSLRRVEAYRELFRSRIPAVDPEAWWRSFCDGRSPLDRTLNLPRRFLKRLHMFNNITRDRKDHIAHGVLLEDVFVVERAQHYIPGFRLAPLDVAFRFGFDQPPEKAFQITGGVLPFGCHSWPKYREFWRPYLLGNQRELGASNSSSGIQSGNPY
jgi:hypothetical protein